MNSRNFKKEVLKMLIAGETNKTINNIVVKIIFNEIEFSNLAYTHDYVCTLNDFINTDAYSLVTELMKEQVI